MAALATLVLLLGVPAAGQPLTCPAQGRTTGGYFENDTHWLTRTSQSDDDYTAAFRLFQDRPTGSLTGAPGHERLWFEARRDRCFARELGFGASLYTPNDTAATTLLRDQRPYTGWTYVYYAVSAHDFDATMQPARMQAIELYVGIVGPGAGGEFIQNTFHRVTNVRKPDGYIRKAEGWHNQLKNEPALLAIYRQRRRLGALSAERVGKWTDVALGFNGALGNVFTHAEGRLLGRLGYNISNDLGPVERITSVQPRRRPPDHRREPRGWLELYAFAQGGGRLVARNVSLDGTLFRDAHHRVTKKPAFAEAEIGVVVRAGPIRVTWRTVVRGSEFDEQDRRQQFGSLTASWSTAP